MQEWYIMNNTTSPNITGGFENDAFLDYREDAFSEALSTDMGTTVILFSKEFVKLQNIRVIIQGNSYDSKLKSTERILLTQIGVLQTGMFIYFENEYWLVTGRPGNNGIYDKTIMQECNWNLKWQDETGAILSYPCVTSSKSFGEDADKVITLPSNQKYILLPFNEHTSKLKADDRFFVDRKNPPTPYKIIGDTDTTSYMGLIQILVEADILRDGDNIELGVCDYVKSDVTLPPKDNTYSSVSINGNLNIGGSKRTFTPTFYNSDGTLQSGIAPVWEIILPSGYESYFTVNYVGDNCTIQVRENYNLIGLNVTVKVCDSIGNYEGELIVEIGSGW